MRWGDHLEFSDEAGAGDFIYVPPFVPHQEINALPDEVCECVVVRSGQEPIVINLQMDTPEPASAVFETGTREHRRPRPQNDTKSFHN